MDTTPPTDAVRDEQLFLDRHYVSALHLMAQATDDDDMSRLLTSALAFTMLNGHRVAFVESNAGTRMAGSLYRCESCGSPLTTLTREQHITLAPRLAEQCDGTRPAPARDEPAPKIFCVAWRVPRETAEPYEHAAAYLIVAATKTAAIAVCKRKVADRLHTTEQNVTIVNARYIVDGSPAFDADDNEYEVTITFARP